MQCNGMHHTGMQCNASKFASLSAATPTIASSLSTHTLYCRSLSTHILYYHLSIYPPLPHTHTHTHTHTDKHTIAYLLLLHFIYNLHTLPTEELLSFCNSNGWILACGLFESVWVEVAAAVHLTHVDFCKIFYGEPPLNWEERGGRKVVSCYFGRLRRISRIWGFRVFGL